MNTHLNVTIIINDYAYDMRIPINQSVKDLMLEIFDVNQINISKKNYHIKIMNKDIVILENEMLSSYPLSNGDVIKLL